MKKSKRHTGYKRYNNLPWYWWLDINDSRDRERRLMAEGVAEKVRHDVAEVFEKYNVTKKSL